MEHNTVIDPFTGQPFEYVRMGMGLVIPNTFSGILKVPDNGKDAGHLVMMDGGKLPLVTASSMTLEECAKYLEVSTSRVSYMLTHQQLQGYTVPKRTYIMGESAYRYAQERRTHGRDDSGMASPDTE